MYQDHYVLVASQDDLIDPHYIPMTLYCYYYSYLIDEETGARETK
jgi:hypothetical protein